MRGTALTATDLWILITLIGLGTFGLRLSFIHFWGRIRLPDIVHRALRFIPPAVLSALVVPALVSPEGFVDFSPHNLRLLAGLIAAAVALLTRNVLLTLTVGMCALWLLQMLVGA